MMIIAIVILPMTLIAASLTPEALAFYGRVQSGELDLVRFFQQVHDILPAWAINLLDRFGLASLGAVQQKLSAALMAGSQYIATQALNIGQSTFDFVANLFVMLYLLFFLLRDEDALSTRIRDAIPLHAKQQRAFFLKFTVVIRATVKGDMLVALLQGTLGGPDIRVPWDWCPAVMSRCNGFLFIGACDRCRPHLDSGCPLSSCDRCYLARHGFDSVRRARHRTRR